MKRPCAARHTRGVPHTSPRIRPLARGGGGGSQRARSKNERRKDDEEANKAPPHPTTTPPARVLRRGPPAFGPHASRASPVAIRTGETRSARSGEERETQQWQRPTGRLEKHRSTTVAATHSPRARADAAPHRRTRLASCAPRPRSRVLVPLVEWTAMAMAHQFETMMNRT